MTAPPPSVNRRAFSEPASTDLASMSRHDSASTTAPSLAIRIHRARNELGRRRTLRPGENEGDSDHVNATFRILEDRHPHSVAILRGPAVTGEATDGIDQEKTLLWTSDRTEVLSCLATLHRFGSRQLLGIEAHLLVRQRGNCLERVCSLDASSRYRIHPLA